jgi:hypothetical protein
MQDQLTLFDYFNPKPVKTPSERTQHGGTFGKNHRKELRPLSTKKWIHVVLKSDKAYGPLSFLHPNHELWIEKLLHEKAKKFGVKIGDYANMGNHLHLKVKISSRENFGKFLKSVSSLISRKVTGAKRGKPFGRFWQGLAYTRILTSPTEESQLKDYIEASRREVRDSKQAREDFLAQFNQWIYRQRRKSKSTH